MRPLDKAISSYLFAKEIQGLSPNTIRNYRLTLSRFVSYFGDEIPDLKDISPHDIRAFLHTLKTTAPDNRSIIPREPKPLSPKSIAQVLIDRILFARPNLLPFNKIGSKATIERIC